MAGGQRAVEDSDSGLSGVDRGRLGHGRVLDRPPKRSARRIAQLNQAVDKANPDFPSNPNGPLRPPRTQPLADDGADDPLGPGRFGDDPRGEQPPPFTQRPRAGAPSGPAAGPAAAGDFTFFRNQPVAQGDGVTSQVGEPSWANDRNASLFTGNWHAAISDDAGINWSFLDPDTQFPSVFGGFCCDQVALAADRGPYSLVFWLLQYSDDGDEGGVRLVTYQGRDELLSQDDYCSNVFSPEDDFGFEGDFWMDFNQMAVTDKYLYITSNVYEIKPGDDTFEDGILWRIALSDLDDGNCSVAYRYYTKSADYSTTPVQGAGNEMFYAYHGETNDKLTIWRLPDSTNTATKTTKTVSNFVTTNKGDMDCPTPDGFDPCARGNARISTGWLADDMVAWAWNVADGGGYPFPHIRMARFRASDLALVDEPDIWNRDYAWVYPGVNVNARGDLGITLYRIGGGQYPRARAALVDDIDTTLQPLNVRGILTSTDGADENKWGDYGSVRPYGDCPNTFGSAVFTMQGGPSDGDAEHRFAWFGRERDGCSNLLIGLLDVRELLIRSGRKLSIRVQTRNAGSGQAQSSQTRFYLSRDARRSRGDVALEARVPVNPLGPGDSEGRLVEATAPRSARGSYYVLACADDRTAVRELAEDDNCSVSDRALAIGPATAVVGIGVPELPVRPGASLSISESLVAAGRTGAGAIDYYLDTRPAATGRAIRLGRARAGAIRGDGAPLESRRRFRLPRGARARHYYVIACIGGRRTAAACLPSDDIIHVARPGDERPGRPPS